MTQLLTAREVQARLGCSASTRQRLDRAGELTPLYIGVGRTRPRYSADDVEAYIRRLRERAADRDRVAA